MTDVFPRRFVNVAPPSGMAWIMEALNRAYRCPGDRPAIFERLLGLLKAK